MNEISINNNIQAEDLESKLKETTSLTEQQIQEIVPVILDTLSEIREMERKRAEDTTKEDLSNLTQAIESNSDVSINMKNNKGTVIGAMNFNTITNNISITINQPDSQPTTESVPEQPTIESVPEQPTTESVSEQPTTESVPEQPTTESVPEQPITESVPEQPDLKLDSYEWYTKALSQLIFEIDWCAATAKYKRWLNKSWKETLKTAKAKLKQYKDIISDKKTMLEHELKAKDKLNAKNPDKVPLTVSISASEINWLKRRRGDRRKAIEEDIKAGQRGESSNIAPWPNQSLEQVIKWNRVDSRHVEYDSKLNEALQDTAFLRIIDNNQDRAREFLQAIANNSLSDAQITICQMRKVQLDPYFEKYGMTDQVHRCIQTRGWRYTQSVINYWNMDWETAYKTWWVVGWLNNTLIKAFPNAKPEQVSSFTNVAVAAGWIYAIYRIWKWFFGKNEKWERNLWLKTAGLASLYFVPQLLLWKDWYSLLWEILSWKADFSELKYRGSNCLWFLNGSSPEVYNQMAPGLLWMHIFPAEYTVAHVRTLQQTFSDKNVRRKRYSVTYARLNRDNTALSNEFKNTFNENEYKEDEWKDFLAKLWIKDDTSWDIVIFNEAAKTADKKTSFELWMKSQWKQRRSEFKKEIDAYIEKKWEFNPDELNSSWFEDDEDAKYTMRKEDIENKEELWNQVDDLSLQEQERSELKVALADFYDERTIGSKPNLKEFSLKIENWKFILKSHGWYETEIDLDKRELVWFWNGITFTNLSDLLNVADLTNKILESQKWKVAVSYPPFQYKWPSTILENWIGKWWRWIYFNDAEGVLHFDTRVLSGGWWWTMWKIDTLWNNPKEYANYLSERRMKINKPSST